MCIGDGRPCARGVLVFDDLCFMQCTGALQLAPAPTTDALLRETQRIREKLLQKQRSQQEVRQTTIRQKASSPGEEYAPAETPRAKKPNKRDICGVCGLNIKEGAKRTFGRSKACNRRARWCDGECATRRAERNGLGASADTCAAPPEPENCQWCGKVIKEGSGWRKVCNGKCHVKNRKRRSK